MWVTSWLRWAKNGLTATYCDSAEVNLLSHSISFTLILCLKWGAAWHSYGKTASCRCLGLVLFTIMWWTQDQTSSLLVGEHLNGTESLLFQDVSKTHFISIYLFLNPYWMLSRLLRVPWWCLCQYPCIEIQVNLGLSYWHAFWKYFLFKSLLKVLNMTQFSGSITPWWI